MTGAQWKWLILFLALLSSGCVIEAQQAQLAKCELEHPRKSRPTGSPYTDYIGQIGDENAMTACMRAAGYAYDIHPRKCYPGPNSEWSAFCYRPAQGPWRWLSLLEDSDDPVKIFIRPTPPPP